MLNIPVTYHVRIVAKVAISNGGHNVGKVLPHCFDFDLVHEVHRVPCDDLVRRLLNSLLKRGNGGYGHSHLHIEGYALPDLLLTSLIPSDRAALMRCRNIDLWKATIRPSCVPSCVCIRWMFAFWTAKHVSLCSESGERTNLLSSSHRLSTSGIDSTGNDLCQSLNCRIWGEMDTTLRKSAG